MTDEEKIKALEAMRVSIEKWAFRLLKLKKKKGITELEFCKKHKLHYNNFNRLKNKGPIKNPSQPVRSYDMTKPKFDLVEKALSDEGV